MYCELALLSHVSIICLLGSRHVNYSNKTYIYHVSYIDVGMNCGKKKS